MAKAVKKKTNTSTDTPNVKQNKAISKVPTSLYYNNTNSHQQQPLIVSHHPQILTIQNFYSHEFSTNLLQQLQSQLTLETTPLIKSRHYAARVNDRISIEDPQSALNLWKTLKCVLDESGDDELQKEFSLAKGLNPNIRIYRYGKGQYFGKHVDESVRTFVPPGVTKWTVLLYLTGSKEGLVGGDTVFYDHFSGNANERIEISPAKGLVCLHKHGDDCLEHEAMGVADGEKWVLRTDVVF